MGEIDKYTTILTPEQQIAYQVWKKTYAPNDSGVDYDLQGAFLGGLTPGTNGHWSDKYKKPNHPTFSNQSQYATGDNTIYAGSWKGDTYVPPNIKYGQLNDAKSILAGEGAGDPLGWDALLNTYNADRKPGDSLVDAMKRNSSAYRGRSNQYIKYSTGKLNPIERIVDTAITAKVKSFRPNSQWNYKHHESLTANKAYNNDLPTMIKILKTKWGSDVDYVNPIKIGQQYYFKRIIKPRVKAVRGK